MNNADTHSLSLHAGIYGTWSVQHDEEREVRALAAESQAAYDAGEMDDAVPVTDINWSTLFAD